MKISPPVRTERPSRRQFDRTKALDTAMQLFWQQGTVVSRSGATLWASLRGKGAGSPEHRAAGSRGDRADAAAFGRDCFLDEESGGMSAVLWRDQLGRPHLGARRST